MTHDAAAAARRWADTWARAWPLKDRAAIVRLYAESAVYRALAFRDPKLGLAGVNDYLATVFSEEDEIECSFGTPIVSGDRAAIEWWGSWVEDGKPLTLAGVSILRFDDAGKVVDHRDYWNEAGGRVAPYPEW